MGRVHLTRGVVASGCDEAWSSRDLWRALCRAWGLSWRFYDRPDQYFEIRRRPGDPWISLHRPGAFRMWNLMLAPETVDKMWCEGRVRALVAMASEQGSLSVGQYQALGERLSQLCGYNGLELPSEGWSLRSLGAMNHELYLEIHCPVQARRSCGV